MIIRTEILGAEAYWDCNESQAGLSGRMRLEDGRQVVVSTNKVRLFPDTLLCILYVTRQIQRKLSSGDYRVFKGFNSAIMQAALPYGYTLTVTMPHGEGVERCVRENLLILCDGLEDEIAKQIEEEEAC